MCPLPSLYSFEDFRVIVRFFNPFLIVCSNLIDFSYVFGFFFS